MLLARRATYCFCALALVGALQPAAGHQQQLDPKDCDLPDSPQIISLLHERPSDSCRGATKNRSLKEAAECPFDREQAAEVAPTAEDLGSPHDQRVARYAATLWKFDYIYEQSEKHRILVDDPTLDARLANVVATLKETKIVGTDPHKINLGSPELDRRVAESLAGPQVDHELCGRHLSGMLEQLDELSQIVESIRGGNTTRSLGREHLLLAHVLDSFGRYESGQLVGKSHFLGAQPQCLAGQLELGEQPVSTRYCWAKMKTERHLSESLRSSLVERPLVSVAICIPETCHSAHHQEHLALYQRLVNSQFKLPESLFVDQTLELESIFCPPDSSSNFGVPTSGKMLIALLVGWVLLVAYATFGHSTSDKATKLDRFLGALNLADSWRDFVSETEKPKRGLSRVDLNTLNSVKVLCCAFVVMGHSFLVCSVTSMNFTRTFRLVELDPLIYLIIGGTVVTDTFFVLTGMILTYIALRKLSPKAADNAGGKDKIGEGALNSVKMSLMFIANRYVRLIPLFCIVFWFKKGVLINLTGMGPMYDNGFNADTLAGGCRQESWLSPLYAASAFLPLARQCMPHAWSVADDIAFCLLLGPIIVAFVKRPKLGVAAAVLLSLASNAVMFRALQQIPDAMVLQMRDLSTVGVAGTFRYYSSIYTYPHLRCFAALIGALAGFALYHYDETRKISQWPNWMTGLATKLSFMMAILTLTAPMIASLLKQGVLARHPVHINIRLLDYSLTIGRLFWDVANAILFLRMVTDWRDTFTMRYSAGKFWQALVRLNYAILLIHMDVILYGAQNQTNTELFSRSQILTTFTSRYALCCLAAIPIYLLLENPIDKATKMFFAFGGSRQQNQISSGVNGAIKSPHDESETQCTKI